MPETHYCRIVTEDEQLMLSLDDTVMTTLRINSLIEFESLLLSFYCIYLACRASYLGFINRNPYWGKVSSTPPDFFAAL